MPTLYVVGTPIGNLEDTTLRALRVLGEVSLIAAEDTRTTRKLLSRYEINAPRLVSYNDRNRRQRTPQILKALEEGDVALVSEAGMPAISDPGAPLVAAAAEAGHEVVPIPGPSSVLTALAVSGLPVRSFRYLGFLPRLSGPRRRLLHDLASSEDTLVAFEAPHRLQKALADLLDVLGDRRVAICRELTKLHEEVFRGTTNEAIAHFSKPRGEFTIVVEGAEEMHGTPQVDVDIAAELLALRHEGKRAREAVRSVSERFSLPHREVYDAWLALPERS